MNAKHRVRRLSSKMHYAYGGAEKRDPSNGPATTTRCSPERVVENQTSRRMHFLLLTGFGPKLQLRLPTERNATAAAATTTTVQQLEKQQQLQQSVHQVVYFQLTPQDSLNRYVL